MALIKCPNCGRDMSDKAFKCPECGMPIEQVREAMLRELSEKQDEASREIKVTPTETLPRQIKKKKSSAWIWIIILIGVLTATIGLYLWLSQSKQADSNNINTSFNAQSRTMETNAHIFDNDGDFTNIRNVPQGKVIDKVPTAQGRFGVWLDYNNGDWYHIKDAKLYDSEKGIVRKLNGTDCWIHKSIVRFDQVDVVAGATSQS